MHKILLLVRHKGNFKVLSDLLGKEDQVIGEEDWDEPVDLVVTDYVSFREYQETLVKTKEDLRPILMPLLLMVSSTEKNSLKKFDLAIEDELIETPVKSHVLKMRVKSMLQLQKFSLGAEKRYLFHFIDKYVPVGICILQNECITYSNEALCHLLDRDKNHLLETALLDFVVPQYKTKLLALIKELSSEASYREQEVQVFAGTEKRWVNLRLLNITYNDTPSIIASITDITDRKNYEKELRYLSFHDQLTGLYNRAFFEEEMERLQKSREYPITIIMSDLNGLKIINDSLGHKKGDELLQAGAKLLQESLRDSDILARVGGDEFAIFLPNTSEDNGEVIIKRIYSNLEQHNKINPDLPVSISAGLASAVSSEESLKKKFGEADTAMYKDKRVRGEGARVKIVNTLMLALNEKDYINEGHAQRLVFLCQSVGKKINLPSHQINRVALLAQVHDLGKVGVPDKILSKKAPLNNEEWKIIKQHSEKGYRIALTSPHLSDIADLIHKHHEKWDGSGYPLGLAGEDIPVECRILAIADAYDAMTNNRPYRDAMSKKDAIEELKNKSGSQFDPKLVEVFLAVLEEDSEN